VIGLAGGNDAKFAGSPYPGKPLGEHSGGPHLPIVSLDGKALVDAETLWSCTTCRACVEECPMMIEHVDAIVDMRRHLTLEKGATPNKGAEVLENLIATDNPGGFAPGGRLNWAADLNLPLMSEKKQADVLFWVGDGAFDMRNQRTLRAFVKILRAARVDFAVLGLEERDSGDVARRLGDEATFQSLARRNIATLSRYRFKRIVSCDPHSFHVLKNEYGALGGHYEVLHHTTFIDELVRQGALRLGRSKADSVTYHDPCYLGRYNGEYQAPRNVLKALGIEVREMQRSGFRSRCCGGGAGMGDDRWPGTGIGPLRAGCRGARREARSRRPHDRRHPHPRSGRNSDRDPPRRHAAGRRIRNGLCSRLGRPHEDRRPCRRGCATSGGSRAVGCGGDQRRTARPRRTDRSSVPTQDPPVQ